jgi:hypothetical protein
LDTNQQVLLANFTLKNARENGILLKSRLSKLKVDNLEIVGSLNSGIYIE